jgi:hypothetical protein
VAQKPEGVHPADAWLYAMASASFMAVYRLAREPLKERRDCTRTFAPTGGNGGRIPVIATMLHQQTDEGVTEMANITTLNRSGRKPGAKNRIQADAKGMLEQAMERAGGVNYLARQAEENPSAFLALVGKLLPKNIDAQVSGPDNAPMAATIRFVGPGETAGCD